MMLQVGVGLTCEELENLAGRCRELSKSARHRSPRKKALLKFAEQAEKLSYMIKNEEGK